MANGSIGCLIRKKLSDITNSQSQGQPKLPRQEGKPLDDSTIDKDCIQQLLKERVALMQLLAERNKMLELNGAELQMLRNNVRKLQLQNLNLAQSNSHMLAELNLGRERIKALQHELLWMAALLKRKMGKLEMKHESNRTLSQPQEGNERAGQPSIRASKDKKCKVNRGRCISIRRRSTGSSIASTKNAKKDKVEDKRPFQRRQCPRFEMHELQPLENLFEIEDAKYPVSQSRPNLLSSRAVKKETGESSALRNEASKCNSFGRPSRKSVEKVQISQVDSSQMCAKPRVSGIK